MKCRKPGCGRDADAVVNPRDRLGRAPACWEHLWWIMTLVSAKGMTVPVKLR